jgi:signal peptidase I
VLQYGLIALWLGMIPALLTGLVLRFLVPWRGGGVLGVVSMLGRQYPAYLAAALFLLFGALVRYWRYDWPGARYTLNLPPDVASGERARDRLAEWAGDVAIYEWLRSSRTRLDRTLDREKRMEVERQLGELRVGVETRDIERTRTARAAIESIAAAVLVRYRRRRILTTVLTAPAVALGLLAVRARIAEPYRVLSTSMLPTLEPGDRILGNKLAYAWESRAVPHRGDTVVFRASAVSLGAESLHVPDVLIKRVIGLPGDRIAMRGSVPVINDWLVPTCDAGDYMYLLPDASGNALRGRVYVEFLDDRAYLTVHSIQSAFPQPYRVKPGEVFVLGDDRSNSLDSRAYNDGHGGGVPLQALQARPQWFLVGTHRSGDADWGRWFAPIDRLQARLRLEGLDTGTLQSGIARCLQSRPTQTHPPVEPSIRGGSPGP